MRASLVLGFVLVVLPVILVAGRGPSAPMPFTHELRFFVEPKEGAECGAQSGAECGAQSGAESVAESGTVILDPSAAGGLASYESPVLLAKRPFNEALPSWNLDLPEGVSFAVDIRVGRRVEASWSPWLRVGEGGAGEDAGDASRPAPERVTSFDGGAIDVDYFRSPERHDRVQMRIRAFAPAEPGGAESGGARSGGATLRIVRLAVCLSDTTGLPTARPLAVPSPRGAVEGPRAEDPPSKDPSPADPPPADPPPEGWQRRLPVPVRSQRVESSDLAGRICSPTSVAMVLAYRGVDRTTREVCERAWDPVHEIYGNWPRNVQAAYSFGVPGHVTRYASWSEVRREIARGQPLIASIRAEEGQLRGAPYRSTAGHLLVLVGFTREGDVLVNDPAAPGPDTVARVYARDDLEEVWLRRGGTAYVLLPRE